MNFYHYTDIEATKSILLNQKLWLSNVRFLNDGNELKKGWEYVNKKLWEKVEKLCKDKSYSAAEVFHDIDLNDMDSNLKKKNCYTVSFCAYGDLLSQWRGYSPQNSGYNIEFDGGLLKKLANDMADNVYHPINYDLPILRSYFGECSYDDEIVEKNLEDKIDSLAKWEIEYYENQFLAGNKTWKAGQEQINKIEEIYKTVGYWKDSGFSEEKEYRLLVELFKREKKHLKFRNKLGMLIPYVELAIPPESILSVTVGPNPNQKLAEESMRDYIQCLNENELLNSTPEVKVSKIPLRY